MLAAVLTVAAMLIAVRGARRWPAWAAGLVVGGATGNLLDRLQPPIPHAVIDWIHLAGYPPTFNLADVAIRGGVLAGTLIAIVRSRRRVGDTGMAARIPA